MEDWMQMLIIILVVIVGMVAYLSYLGIQIAELRDSVSEYNNLQGALDDARGSGDSSPVTSPFDIILNGIGGSV